MNYQRLFLSGIFLSLFMLSASAKTFIIGNDSTTVRTSDTDYADELEKIRMHMPDIEVGNGISFQPKNKSYKLTMRIRLQREIRGSGYRRPRQTAQVTFRWIYLYTQTHLFSSVRLLALRYENAAQWEQQHRTRRNDLLRSQLDMEYRFRTNQNTGESRPNKLFECPTIRRSFHCKLRIQSRPRFRYLRRIQSTSIRLFGFSGQSLYYYRRRQKLGKQ